MAVTQSIGVCIWYQQVNCYKRKNVKEQKVRQRVYKVSYLHIVNRFHKPRSRHEKRWVSYPTCCWNHLTRSSVQRLWCYPGIYNLELDIPDGLITQWSFSRPPLEPVKTFKRSYSAAANKMEPQWSVAEERRLPLNNGVFHCHHQVLVNLSWECVIQQNIWTLISKKSTVKIWISQNTLCLLEPYHKATIKIKRPLKIFGILRKQTMHFHLFVRAKRPNGTRCK